MRVFVIAVVAFAWMSSTRQALASETNPVGYATMAPAALYRTAGVAQEIALARSAAPASISARAEILVLGNRRYEVAVKGTNGFVCFVERSWASFFPDREFWNAKERAPNCFNARAARSVLPQYLQRTQWAMAGMTKQQIIDKSRAAARRGQTDPEPGSMSLMMSKHGYLSDQVGGPWYPHVMLFVKHGETGTWGANQKGSPIFAGDGLAFESSILFIPVRRWSDGSLAVPGPAPQMQMK